MSGGSGARVNAYTISYIRQQQEQQEHNEQDLFAASSEHEDDIFGMQIDGQSDMEQEEQEEEEQGDLEPFDESDPLDHEDQPVDNAIPLSAIPLSSVPSMDDRNEDDYAKMPEGSIINTKIFDINTSAGLFNPQHDDEAYSVLEAAFAPGLNTDLAELRRTIAEKSNMQVIDVTRLRNKAVHGMHRQFKTSFKIQQTTRVYHGTGHADLIADVGFRGAACQRAKFGRGIYSSPNVFHALSYGHLDARGHLTFLVVELHLGPIALGKQDQVDFGKNATGEPILTLTNLEGDIYCASQGVSLSLSPSHSPFT